jgi:hypothetical protein
MCRQARSNRIKRRRPPPTEQHAERRSVSDAVGAAGRIRSGAEGRARMTATTTSSPAQNGTSGVLAECKHAGRRATWDTPRTGSDRGQGSDYADWL